MKYIVEGILVILLFGFCWKVLGKPLANWLWPEKADKTPDADSVAELKKLRAELLAKKSKLKNKQEIEAVEEEIGRLNAKLAELA